jgi:hypothetical protein
VRVTSRSVEALFSTLNAASVRYLVVGDSLGDLIEMKRVAGRPQDLADIEHLRRLEDGR